ncbi:MAG: hypothetical protein WA949_16390 [Phormidesmis sp.]
MAVRFWRNRRWKYGAVLLGAILLQVLLLALPAFSTERVIVSFGPVERSIAVADLATYARVFARSLTRG